MGSEDKDKGKGAMETLADEAKGLAVEAYKDAAKPAVAAAGGTLGSERSSPGLWSGSIPSNDRKGSYC